MFKPRLLYFKQHFDMEQFILQQTREQVPGTLFLSYHGNKIELIVSSVEERSRSIWSYWLLLHSRDSRNADDWFSFSKENMFYSFNFRCKCLYYILIRLWAINIVDFIFLSTIWFNRGRLTWNSNASPQFDFLHANTKNVKSTCNWHDFELQMDGFLHIVSKEEMCITSHNPLWGSMVYRRIMTVAFLWSLQ